MLIVLIVHNMHGIRNYRVGKLDLSEQLDSEKPVYLINHDSNCI